MDRKTYAIGILTLTAVILFTGMLFAPQNAAYGLPTGASGAVARDRDYTMITGPTQGGGDALYILDNRRGIMVVMKYDNSSRSLRLQAAEPVSNAFKSLQAAPNR